METTNKVWTAMKENQSLKCNILGSDWTIRFVNPDENAVMTERNMFAYEYCISHEIVCTHIDYYHSKDHMTEEELLSLVCTSLRHEIIHAYLDESGLGSCSLPAEAWAVNEEMVDYFATMMPKIYKTFEELDLV